MNFFEGTIDGDSFALGQAQLPLAGYSFTGAKTDGPAVLGIRPEHVGVGDLAQSMPYKSDITVELFEPMGADTLVWTSLHGHPLHFRLDGQVKVQKGQTLTIGFDPSRASLFDTKTELRL